MDHFKVDLQRSLNLKFPHHLIYNIESLVNVKKSKVIPLLQSIRSHGQ